MYTQHVAPCSSRVYVGQAPGPSHGGHAGSGPLFRPCGPLRASQGPTWRPSGVAHDRSTPPHSVAGRLSAKDIERIEQFGWNRSLEWRRTGEARAVGVPSADSTCLPTWSLALPHRDYDHLHHEKLAHVALSMNPETILLHDQVMVAVGGRSRTVLSETNTIKHGDAATYISRHRACHNGESMTWRSCTSTESVAYPRVTTSIVNPLSGSQPAFTHLLTHIPDHIQSACSCAQILVD